MTVFLETERLTLRRFTIDDVDLLVELDSDPEVMFWITGGRTTSREEIETDNEYTMVHSYGGYTTNLPLEDLVGGKAWIVYEYEGEPLHVEHGGPARLLVPHLYFWKSAKWVKGVTMQRSDEPGFWENFGYHNYGNPWREERYAGD